MIEAIKAHWGISLADVKPLRLGYDAGATTYRGTAVDGQAYFVKRKRSLDPGLAVACALRESGVEAATAPLRTLEGGIAHLSPEGTLLVYPWIEGHNGLQRPFALWAELGRAARRIHEVELPSDVERLVERETFRVARAERFALMLDAPPPRLSGLLAEYAVEIECILRRTRELGDVCRVRTWNLALCHADLHVGNLLQGIGGRLHIVDWDAPRLAPRERDLMFVMDGGIFGHGPEAEAAFFEGYGPYEADPTALTYYRYAWALDDFASFAEETLSSDPAKAEEAVAMFADLFHPKAIVASAFRSDDRLAGA